MLQPINLRALTSSRLINTAANLNRVSSKNLHRCSAKDDDKPNSKSSHHPQLLASCCSSFYSSSLPLGSAPPNSIGHPSFAGVNASHPTNNWKVFKRGISIYRPLFTNEEDKEESSGPVVDDGGSDEADDGKSSGTAPKKRPEAVARHLDRDRSKKIPVETSMRYLKSIAYQEAYGENPVWVLYRRNFPGQWAPKKTRKTCIRNDEITTGNPCPICRDIYLVVDYRNVDLLKQFISPYTGEVLGWNQTGICRRQHERLLIEIDRAKDYGTMTFDVPFREYDLKEYEKIYESY